MTFFKGLFSDRKKIQTAPTALVKDQFTPELINAICNCYEQMWRDYERCESAMYGRPELTRTDIEEELWAHFLNQKISEFSKNNKYITTSVNLLNSQDATWYQKLDMIEYTIKFIDDIVKEYKFRDSAKILKDFISHLNFEFKRLDSAYRVVNNEIVEVNSKEEIQAINEALKGSKDNVREHLSKALSHYSERPIPDIRNSIKESISAVEAVCREITGDNQLGDALINLKKKGVVIHPILQTSLTKLYAYTNNPDTGIRHAMMDETGANAPTKDEAYFMLISCSAFVNYIRMKVASKS